MERDSQRRIGFVSSSGRDYELVVPKNDRKLVYCSCPAWRFQKNVKPEDRRCKHLKALEAMPDDFVVEEGMILA